MENENKEEEKGTVRAESKATQQIIQLESIRMERLSFGRFVHSHSCCFGVIERSVLKYTNVTFVQQVSLKDCIFFFIGSDL